jgi:predicted outer membrane lipoprotein
MEQITTVRPKIGRPPGSGGAQHSFDTGTLRSKKRAFALGVMATAAFGLLSALLLAQKMEGVKKQKMLAAIESTAAAPEDASEAVSVSDSTGKETLKGSMVVVGASDPSIAHGEPAKSLSEEDKKRLLEIIGRH